MSLATRAEDSKFNKKTLEAIFASSPFYLISTHGAYNLDRPDWYFKVPENTYIFETQVITDYCLTSVDEPLFDLLQGVNRKAFNYYLLNNRANTNDYRGSVNIASGGQIQLPKTYRQVIQQLILYGPGDTIPIREISIGRVGSNSRQVYMGMTLNKFEPGQDAVKFPGERETLILHERAQLHEQLIADLETTNKEIIEKISEMPKESGRDPSQARIFFFSSCASIPYKPTEKDANKRILDIESIQRNQILKMLASGIQSARGGSGGPSVSITAAERNTLPRAAKTTERFAAESTYVGNEMSAHDPRLMLNNLMNKNAAGHGPYPSGRTNVKYLYKYIPATSRSPEKHVPYLSSQGTPELRRRNLMELDKLSDRNKKNIFEYLPDKKKYVPYFTGGFTRKAKKRKNKTIKRRNYK